MEDYYAVVGVGRAASTEELDRKVREQLRIWQRRTTNADLSRRQEAERRVQLLSEARATLLDPDKRRSYDVQLMGTATTNLPAETTPAPPGSAADWIARARRHLANNDYQAAAYAARQARDAPNPPPAVWGVLARSSAGLGRLDDALYEAQQGVERGPGDAQSHLDLAHVYEQRGDWTQAFEEYEIASRVDPNAEAPTAGMTRALASSARPTEAVDRLERRYARATPSERGTVGMLLGKALVATAQRSARGPRGEFRISSMAQEHDILEKLRRAGQVTSDPEVLAAVDTLQRFVVQHPRRYGPNAGYGARPRSGYGAGRPGYATPRPPARTNPLAIAALTCALVGLMVWFPAPVGAILGHVARRQIQERGELGDGLALAGIVIGWVVTGFACCAVGYVAVAA